MPRLATCVVAALCVWKAWAEERCEAACTAASDASYCARLGAGRSRAQLAGVCSTAWAAGAAVGCARGCGGATCVGMGLAEALNAARSAACASLGGSGGGGGGGGAGARALDVCREGFILAARDGCAQAERSLVAANASQERLLVASAAAEAAAAAAAAAEAATAANVSTATVGAAGGGAWRLQPHNPRLPAPHDSLSVRVRALSRRNQATPTVSKDAPPPPPSAPMPAAPHPPAKHDAGLRGSISATPVKVATVTTLVTPTPSAAPVAPSHAAVQLPATPSPVPAAAAPDVATTAAPPPAAATAPAQAAAAAPPSPASPPAVAEPATSAPSPAASLAEAPSTAAASPTLAPGTTAEQ